MKTDVRLGTFEEVLAGADPGVARIARRLRAMISAVHADAIEVARPGEGTSAYGLGPKKMSEAYAYIAPYNAHVNLGFHHGASLPDTDGLLEGTGKGLRHVKVWSLEEAKRPVLRRLVKAALQERRTALGR